MDNLAPLSLSLKNKFQQFDEIPLTSSVHGWLWFVLLQNIPKPELNAKVQISPFKRHWCTMEQIVATNILSQTSLQVPPPPHTHIEPTN